MRTCLCPLVLLQRTGLRHTGFWALPPLPCELKGSLQQPSLMGPLSQVLPVLERLHSFGTESPQRHCDSGDGGSCTCHAVSVLAALGGTVCQAVCHLLPFNKNSASRKRLSLLTEAQQGGAWPLWKESGFQRAGKWESWGVGGNVHRGPPLPW